MRSLMGGSQKHLLRSWPRPGVNDDAKRRLLSAAAAASSAAELEATRLGECLGRGQNSANNSSACSNIKQVLVLAVELAKGGQPSCSASQA